MRFEVHATITEVYYVDADDFDQAIAIASDREQPDDTTSHGFDHVINLHTGAELFM